MSRSTKIVATLGPASSDPQTLERMFLAGVDIVRLNFSHGTAADHERRAELVREACRKTGRTVGIMGDLQGPKIRIGKFKEGKVTLAPGDAFVLDADCELGEDGRVGLDYKELPRDVKPGDMLLLDDGKIVFEVERVAGNQVHNRVRHGGVLSNNKGINRLGGGLTAPALPPKDMEDIRTAAKINVDYLAVSFPKSSADMYMAKQLLLAAGGDAFLIAKIERAEAVEPKALTDIMSACEGIMVARGDLAVEVGDASVPALQKRMIRMAREQNKLTITATQMMESMISSPVPTRAEVSDVANAVLDGTDAVMLSAETAAGQYPVEAVAYMDRIARAVEPSLDYRHELPEAHETPTIGQAMSNAACDLAEALQARAILVPTFTGRTANAVARLRPRRPIIALTHVDWALRQLALEWGVTPLLITEMQDVEELWRLAVEAAHEAGIVESGDGVVITAGTAVNIPGTTNVIKVDVVQ